MAKRCLRQPLLSKDRSIAKECPALTHLNIESSRLGYLLEHFFQSRERSLDEITPAVAFEALPLEVASMLHPFAHIR